MLSSGGFWRKRFSISENSSLGSRALITRTPPMNTVKSTVRKMLYALVMISPPQNRKYRKGL